ncbi:MAG: hypothetical protein RL220_1869 [Bacteroidota bacterium]
MKGLTSVRPFLFPKFGKRMKRKQRENIFEEMGRK